MYWSGSVCDVGPLIITVGGCTVGGVGGVGGVSGGVIGWPGTSGIRSQVAV
jgi:hypothetical protein